MGGHHIGNVSTKQVCYIHMSRSAVKLETIVKDNSQSYLNSY